MNPIDERNSTYIGASGRQSLYDLVIPKDWNGKIILFSHGYMGFKDWGPWDSVMHFFVTNGYGFSKYNVSHNGATTEHPFDFHDLTSFAQNTYTKELYDFDAMLTLLKQRFPQSELYGIGHSRGGGIVAIQSGLPNLSKWVSWAGISTIENRFPEGESLKEWQKNGVRFVKNGRTLQQLPHSYLQYEDFMANKTRLNIEQACRNTTKPCLIIHGDQDTSVSIKEGKALARWTKTKLQSIAGAQHTFNTSHPWDSVNLGAALQQVCEKTLVFFNHEHTP
jgi:pimeloyl-ACP methyl ester carboxylesterase